MKKNLGVEKQILKENKVIKLIKEKGIYFKI
jgi:hypothetical protein